MKITVIGSGVMGPGIAQVFLMGGHDVYLTDVYEESLAKGKKSIVDMFAKMAEMEVIDVAPEQYLEHLVMTTDLAEAVPGSKLIIEAIPEKIELKKELFAKLAQLCDDDAIVASNTSSLPLPEMFPEFKPGNFMVAHFFNPPPIIPLVEIVKNDGANDEAVNLLKQLLLDCGKEPIVINKFIPGFLVNRMQTATSREGLYLLEQGVVSAEDLDKVSLAAMGFKSAWQGMFDTMDFIGLDTVLFVNDIIFPQLCNATSTPEIIREKVVEGKLGVKAGEGFYSYQDGRADEVMERRTQMLLEQLKLWNKYKPCEK